MDENITLCNYALIISHRHSSSPDKRDGLIYLFWIRNTILKKLKREEQPKS